MPGRGEKRRRTDRVRRPEVELHEALRRCVRLLSGAAARFDDGDRDEAFTMAVTLRSLLHYGSSRPLLHELGVIKRLDYVDTGPAHEPGFTTLSGGLHRIRVSSLDSSVEAPLEAHDTGRRRPYTPWWKHDRVILDEAQKWHTRWFLVTQMANTDAAHFDPFGDPDYDALKAFRGGWLVGAAADQLREPGGDVATASIRQIAWEVLATLNGQCAELLVEP